MERCHEPALSWRMVLPVLGAVAVVFMLLAPSLRHSGSSSPAPVPPRTQVATQLKSDLPPTVASYRVVANRSIDALDDLLTRQANKPLAPAPVYRASTLALAKIPD